jgi:hypothetical protein
MEEILELETVLVKACGAINPGTYPGVGGMTEVLGSPGLRDGERADGVDNVGVLRFGLFFGRRRGVRGARIALKGVFDAEKLVGKKWMGLVGDDGVRRAEAVLE